MLSAQSTDRRVNAVTPTLFARYPDAAAYAAADPAEMEELIRPTGFFRAKTGHLIGLGAALVDKFGGEVPGTLSELVTLPGVGRKTANVVLGNAFGVPGITPDTHFIRLSNRFGWVASSNPDAVERAVGALFDPETGSCCATASSGTGGGGATRGVRPAGPARWRGCAPATARVRPTPRWRPRSCGSRGR